MQVFVRAQKKLIVSLSHYILSKKLCFKYYDNPVNNYVSGQNSKHSNFVVTGEYVSCCSIATDSHFKTVLND